MALRVAGLLLAVGARQATAVVRLQGATLIFFSLLSQGQKTQLLSPFYLYSSLKRVRFPPQS